MRQDWKRENGTLLFLGVLFVLSMGFVLIVAFFATVERAGLLAFATSIASGFSGAIMNQVTGKKDTHSGATVNVGTPANGDPPPVQVNANTGDVGTKFVPPKTS